MKFEHTTDRLILKILDQKSGSKVLDFYNNNLESFERYETDRPANFYTASYQSKILQLENTERQMHRFYRFYFFLKEDPNTIIGTVSFSHITLGSFKRAVIGYKIDGRYENMGLTTEAVMGAINILCDSLNLHRIEAYINPNNHASIRIVEKLGFIPEGIAHDYAYIHGSYVDLLRYAYIRKEQEHAGI